MRLAAWSRLLGLVWWTTGPGCGLASVTDDPGGDSVADPDRPDAGASEGGADGGTGPGGLDAAASGGACDPAAARPPADELRTLQHAGLTRRFYVHVPPTYAATPTPVVMGFHGYLSNALQQADWSNMNAKADAEGFIAI